MLVPVLLAWLFLLSSFHWGVCMRLFKFFVLGFVVLAFLSACGMSSSSPEAVAKQYVEAGLEGDVDTMMELLYLPEEENETEGVRDVMRGKLMMSVGGMKQQVAKKGGVDSVEVEDAVIKEVGDNKTARVRVLVQYGNDSEPEGEWVDLRQTDDGWKVALRMF